MMKSQHPAGTELTNMSYLFRSVSDSSTEEEETVTVQDQAERRM